MKLREFAKAQIRKRIQEYEEKGLLLMDKTYPRQQWRFDDVEGVRCGGEKDVQPPLLSSKVNEESLEEEIMVDPLGEVLQLPTADRIYNTDEKPIQLSYIGADTIVFKDRPSASNFVPQDSRYLNTTLVMTTRGDGEMFVTIIFPGTHRPLEPGYLEVLNRCEFVHFHFPIIFYLSNVIKLH